MCNFAISKHFTEKYISALTSTKWNFGSTVFKSQQILSRVTFPFVNMLSIAAWFLLVTSDKLVMTCPVVGSSFFFDLMI